MEILAKGDVNFAFTMSLVYSAVEILVSELSTRYCCIVDLSQDPNQRQVPPTFRLLLVADDGDAELDDVIVSDSDVIKDGGNRTHLVVSSSPPSPAQRNLLPVFDVGPTTTGRSVPNIPRDVSPDRPPTMVPLPSDEPGCHGDTVRLLSDVSGSERACRVSAAFVGLRQNSSSIW